MHVDRDAFCPDIGDTCLPVYLLVLLVLLPVVRVHQVHREDLGHHGALPAITEREREAAGVSTAAQVSVGGGASTDLPADRHSSDRHPPCRQQDGLSVLPAC